MAAPNACIFVLPAVRNLSYWALISGLKLLADTAAKNNLALILAGPDLLRVVRPLKEPDSFNLGISPT